jgi:hypothetical protein
MKIHNPFKPKQIYVSKVIKSERTTYDRTFNQSKVTNASSDMLIGNFAARRITPDLPFLKMREFYETVGRVQNVVDTMVDNIINREWFFDDTTDGGKGGAYQKELDALEDWKKNKVDTTDMLSQIIRNWLIFGVCIISPKDWIPLQMESLIAKKRDDFGNTVGYIQSINGQDNPINADDYFEIPFINLDRKPWGVGLFSSIMSVNWIDIDGEFPHSALEWYRQTIQDYGRIQHRHGSPKVFYSIEGEGMNQETIDNEIAPMLEGMKPGDRAVVSGALNMVSEAIDGQSRFVEYGKKVQEEVDVGLQSSQNRLITEPSAMADAKEAGENDDDRTLGIMEKIRIFMNKIVIPAITGDKQGHVEFKWGAKDSFTLVLPPAIIESIQAGIITPEQARLMLEEQYHWKIPEPLEAKPDVQPPSEMVKMESQLQTEKVHLMNKIRNKLDSL